MMFYRKKVLITGGAGFIGVNLADRLAREGATVLIYDSMTRAGVEANLDWLVEEHKDNVVRVLADIRDAEALNAAVEEADAVVHLAAQVAVTKSVEDPLEDFGVNLLGTLNLLEALRTKKDSPPLVFASTNKVYGALNRLHCREDGEQYVPAESRIARDGISEGQPLDFSTPYGCSKGAADQYVLDYAAQYDMPACVLRMSCIYGPHQCGNEDQGWVAHFLKQARAGAELTVFGNGKQVRDLLHIDDAVEAYLAVLFEPERFRGEAFNLGGGPENAVSVNRLLAQIGTYFDRPLNVRFASARSGDQSFFVANTEKIERYCGWRPKTPWRRGVTALNDWLAENRNFSSDLPRAAVA